ncbi:MAG: hypothetical protein QF406_09595 [Verrucomicrobiota bacterium]|nr:hypothetical protein [Verrucomicrobiota bacterium]
MMVCQSVARRGKALLGLIIVCSSLGFSAQNHNDGCAARLFYMSGDGAPISATGTPIVDTLTSYQRGNRFRMDLNWVF